MKRMVEDGVASADDNNNNNTSDNNSNSVFEDVVVDPIVRGVVRDWDAMEDLLNYVLYTGLDWEEGNEGQILFTDPLCTPKVSFIFSPPWNLVFASFHSAKGLLLKIIAMLCSFTGC